jgi:Fe-S-cluster containining protein
VEDETPAENDVKVTCAGCGAICCRLEVLLITDTGVPEEFIETDRWGGMTMARSEAGWCTALDLDSGLCRIYENRPWICREFEMGGYECIAERAEYARARS